MDALLALAIGVAAAPPAAARAAEPGPLTQRLGMDRRDYELERAAAAALRTRDGVVAVEPDLRLRFARVPDDAVLAPGSPILVLGGQQAVPAGVDEDLRALGYDPVRLAGGVREETAVAIAGALGEIAAGAEVELPAAILASRDVWYDAITSGSLAAVRPRRSC